jgi:putative FmdB family regulatory protein
VPTYEYKCEQCGYVFEVRHSMNEDPLLLCPECKSKAQRMITGGSGFIMKEPVSKTMKGAASIKCGKEQTCCGKETPCETRPCEK